MIHTESTPNPESLKFLSENIISNIGTEEFQKNEINKINNPFIKELLKVVLKLCFGNSFAITFRLYSLCSIKTL